MQTSDKILLKAVAEKDKKAFALFYEKYSRVALCFILSKVHDKSIAKEITQNFWLAFWENPTILRANKDGCVKSFLLQHLRFRIYDMYRIAVPETILAERTDIASTATANGNIEKEELMKIVRDALQNSSLLDRNAFWMRLDNIPAKEVAEELDTTTQTVHNKFSKSLQTVREYIKKHYPEIVANGMKLLLSVYFLR